MIYYTRSARHIAEQCMQPLGNFTVSTFPDGEVCVEIKDDVRNTDVWVIASTPAPGDAIIELLLLLDALQRGGARIHVIFSYFGYARQDRVFPGQPVAAEVMCRLLQPYNLENVAIVHCHSRRLHEFMVFDDIVPYDFFHHAAAEADYIVAPDQGACALAQRIAESLGKPYGCMEKVRTSGTTTEIRSWHGDVAGKRVVIVDDMISTGGTLINAAQYLKECGAAHVDAAATHGLFVGDALNRLDQSCISRIFVTDSLVQKHESPKLTVVKIGPLLCQRSKNR